MNDWLIQQGITNPQMGLVLGLLIGLFAAVIVAWNSMLSPMRLEDRRFSRSSFRRSAILRSRARSDLFCR
jgi:hypothetical protein